MTTTTAQKLDSMQQETLGDRTILVDLRTPRFGINKQLDPDTVDIGEADPDMVRLGKIILDSKELTAIGSYDGNTRRKLALRAPRSRVLRGGMYVCPLAGVDEIEEFLAERLKGRQKLLDRFFTRYAGSDGRTSLVQEAKQKLKADKWNADDYPSLAAVKARFGMTWDFVALTAPGSLSDVSTTLWEREKKKTEKRWRAVREDLVTATVQSMAKLTEHMVERLTPDEDGKKKTFRDTLVENMTEFLDFFAKRNSILGSDELERLTTQARNVLAGVDAEDLRREDDTRGRVLRAFEKIQAATSKMVMKRTRDIQLVD